MKECIILAGGMGTRLKNVLNDIPKCMAPIAGKPFLYYLLKFLSSQDVKHVVFSLGYRHAVVEKWLSKQKFDFEYSMAVENVPLGTGGAIRYGAEKCHSNLFFVVNGDTMFRINFEAFLKSHESAKSKASIAVKHLNNFDRYGSVEFDGHHTITAFNEKKYCESGFINGGIYLIHKQILEHYPIGSNFSFEKDFLETAPSEKNIHAYTEDAYFIDIGIPEDLKKANLEFAEFI